MRERGAVVYVYLLLYQQSKEEIFLEYAKRHAVIVERLLDQDEVYDLLFWKCRGCMG